MQKNLLKPFRTLLAATLLAVCGAAVAASLQVAPTSVVLQPDTKGEALWLSNTDENAPVRAQVRVYRWTQENGEDILEPTRQLAISPPLVELAGGARQLVRVIRLAPPPQDIEASYRIIVDEVPETDDEDQTGLQFLLRYSIPVFVLPTSATPIDYDLVPRLEVQDGTATLIVANRGRQHAQIADLAYVDAAGKRHELIGGLVGYVLPGETMRWPLPAASSRYADGGSFKARINGEAVEQTLALGPARR